MALNNDYSQYYGETHILAPHEGEMIPFYVREVRWQPSVRRQITDDNAHDPAMIRHLEFVGNFLKWDSDRNQAFYQDNIRSIPFSDADLSIPDLGYFDVGGTPVWFANMPQRSTKKGFTLRKINSRNLIRSSESATFVYQMMLDKDRDFFSRHFYRTRNNTLLYKGVVIGSYVNGKLNLKPEALYLQPYIE